MKVRPGEQGDKAKQLLRAQPHELHGHCHSWLQSALLPAAAFFHCHDGWTDGQVPSTLPAPSTRQSTKQGS